MEVGEEKRCYTAALKMEGVTMSQGMSEKSRSWKCKGNRL